uniref:Uncharacterized protein n=1 Tax=Hippocampus comes TaxID=109280 RepID=A0A3Q2XS79_HIPCM
VPKTLPPETLWRRSVYGTVDARQWTQRPGIPEEAQAYDGHSALSAALLEGHGEVAELLMRRGADTDVRDAEGRPLLYLLVLEGRLHMSTLLLEKGGPPLESRDPEGRTALHVASWRGHVDAVDLLLKHGADPNAQDVEGRPPLHSAAWTGRVDVGRRLLLASTVDINLACHQGATALSVAAQQGRADVVALLLEGGADPNHVDKHGRTPVKVARRHGRAEAVRFRKRASNLFPADSSECSVLKGMWKVRVSRVE